MLNYLQTIKPLFILFLMLGSAGHLYYRSFPRPNVVVQQQVERCRAFFATKPTVQATKTFLASESLHYNSLSHDQIFQGKMTTVYQDAHKSQIGSEIATRICRVETPICGFTDEVIVVSFDNKNRFLNADFRESNHGCLDF